jgi:hypothetical protein
MYYNMSKSPFVGYKGILLQNVEFIKHPPID